MNRKTGTGSYTYGNTTHPHQVTGVSNTDGSIILQVQDDKFYWDDYEEKVMGTDTLHYYYVYGADGLAGLHIVKTGPDIQTTTSTTKVITDHLGPLFMHEYGHSFDSRTFGPGYLIEGLFSLGSAIFSIPKDGEPRGVTTHAFFFTERRANQRARDYFGRYYSVSWDSPYELFPDDPYQKGHTIETFYPTKKR